MLLQSTHVAGVSIVAAGRSDEPYSRSNILEGQTKHFVAVFIWFLRNSSLSSKTVHTS